MSQEKFRRAIWPAKSPACPITWPDIRTNRRRLRNSGSPRENKPRQLPQLSFQKSPRRRSFDVKNSVASLPEIGSRRELNQSSPQIFFRPKLSELESQSRRKRHLCWFLACKGVHAREIAALCLAEKRCCRFKLHRITAGIRHVACKTRLQIAVAL